MSKFVKKLEIDALQSTLGGVKNFVLIAPNKIGAALEYNMRKNLRDKKIKVKMVKNTLARKILGESGITVNDSNWSGPTLLAFGGESIKELSQAVDGFVKEAEKKNPKDAGKIKIKTAVADGLEVAFDMALKMPTRQEAIGEIINAILAPASAIAGALTGPASQLASQIATIAEKKEEEVPAAA